MNRFQIVLIAIIGIIYFLVLYRAKIIVYDKIEYGR